MSMQHELTTHVDLLNDRGELNAKGWARRLVATYNRERIAASWLRIKEWDYYCVLTPEYGVAMTISDIGYLASISVTWLDFVNRTEVTETIMKPFTRGSLNLPRTSETGDIAYKDSRIDLRFTRNPASRVLTLDFPGFDHGKGIKGSLRLDQDPSLESMVILTKFDRIEFQIPPDSFVKPWKFVSSDGRFDMDFEPILDRHAKTDIGVIKTVQHQVFGRFTGDAVLDDGTRVHLDHFLGFAEKVFNEW